MAKEIQTYTDDDLCAATPPLEANKMLTSMAVTEGIGSESDRPREGMKIDSIEVRRAYLYAEALRNIYVELPHEDAEE